jgi:hypothetical protein
MRTTSEPGLLDQKAGRDREQAYRRLDCNAHNRCTEQKVQRPCPEERRSQKHECDEPGAENKPLGYEAGFP